MKVTPKWQDSLQQLLGYVTHSSRCGFNAHILISLILCTLQMHAATQRAYHRAQRNSSFVHACGFTPRGCQKAQTPNCCLGCESCEKYHRLDVDRTGCCKVCPVSLSNDRSLTKHRSKQHHACLVLKHSKGFSPILTECSGLWMLLSAYWRHWATQGLSTMVTHDSSQLFDGFLEPEPCASHVSACA